MNPISLLPSPGLVSLIQNPYPPAHVSSTGRNAAMAGKLLSAGSTPEALPGNSPLNDIQKTGDGYKRLVKKTTMVRPSVATLFADATKVIAHDEDRFTPLPNEVKAHIFRYLPLADLLSLSELEETIKLEARYAFLRLSDTARLTQIFDSVRRGDERAVPFCRAADINPATLIEPEKHRTLLIEAIRYNRLAIVLQLLAIPELDINATDCFGLSALHFAVLMNHPAILKKLLLQPEIDVNAVNYQGSTPLHCAATFAHAEMTRLLLAAPGINLNAADNHGVTPLHYAAGMGRVPLLYVQQLSTNIARPVLNEDKINHSSQFISTHHRESLLHLLAAPGINAHSVDLFGCTPLHYAVANSFIAMVSMLIKLPEVDINARDNGGLSPLHLAVFKKKSSIAQLLLTAPKINVNCRDLDGCIPLQYAIRDGHMPLVKMLLAMPGIDYNSADNLGWTPLHSALVFLRNEIALWLIAMPKINVNAAQVEGWTALHFASINGNTILVEKLLSRRDILINARQDDGWTPLHCAAINGCAKVVKQLLARPDIDSKALDSTNCNALFYALIRHHHTTARLLIK